MGPATFSWDFLLRGQFLVRSEELWNPRNVTELQRWCWSYPLVNRQKKYGTSPITMFNGKTYCYGHSQFFVWHHQRPEDTTADLLHRLVAPFAINGCTELLEKMAEYISLGRLFFISWAIHIISCITYRYSMEYEGTPLSMDIYRQVWSYSNKLRLHMNESRWEAVQKVTNNYQQKLVSCDMFPKTS